MSKPVKNLVMESYRRRFGKLEGAVLVNLHGTPSNDNNKLRQKLSTKQIKVTVVSNSLGKKAIAGSKLEPLSKLLVGPGALVHGGKSIVEVARELIGVAKDFKTLQFRGAVMDGVVFGPDQIKELSEYPTREEAQGQIVTLIFSPAQTLTAQIISPGAQIASLIEAVREKKEKAEGAAAPAA